MALEEFGSTQLVIGADDRPLNKKMFKVKQTILRETVAMQKQLDTFKRAAADKIATPLGQAGEQGGKNMSKGIVNGIRSLLAGGGAGGKISSMLGSIGAGGAAALSGPLIAAFAAVAIAAAAAAAAIKLAVAALQRFIQVGRVINRIDAVMRVTGNTVGFTTKQIKAMAAQMSKVGVISERQILRGAAILTTFTNVAGTEFEKSLAIISDLSRAMGVDARTAALQFSKALSQPTTGLATLREAGVIFTAQQREQMQVLEKSGKVVEAQNMLLQIMAENGIGGNAKAADNFVDKWDQLTNASERFLENLGALIGDMLVSSGLMDELVRFANALADALDENSSAMQVMNIVFDDQVGLIQPLLFGLRALVEPLRILADLFGQLNTVTKQHTQIQGRAASAINNLKSITIAATTEIEQAEKKLEEKRKSIAAAREARLIRERITQQVNAKLGIQGLEEAIKKEKKARQEAEADPKTQKAIKANEEADRANDKRIKGIQRLIKELKKKKQEESTSTFVGAEAVFERTISRQFKASAEAARAKKQERIDALEVEKQKLEDQREALAERMKALKDQAKAEIALAKEISAKRIELLEQELQKRKEIAREEIQKGIEEKQLNRAAAAFNKTVFEARKKIAGAFEEAIKFSKLGHLLEDVTRKAMTKGLEDFDKQLTQILEITDRQGIHPDLRKFQKEGQKQAANVRLPKEVEDALKKPPANEKLMNLVRETNEILVKGFIAASGNPGLFSVFNQ
jgi:hypothetical protein